jgi:hypothetical protein
MTREEALDRIRKVYELVNKGEAGERDAAKARLDELMKKYDVTLEELDSNTETTHFYRLHGPRNHEIFAQTAATRGCTRFVFIGPDDNSANSKKLKGMIKGSRPRGVNVIMVCSPIDFIEITTAYEVYQRSFNEHYEAFFYAFLAENDLFYGEADKNREITEKELKMIKRAQMMMFGIDKAEIHKQIETGEK